MAEALEPVLKPLVHREPLELATRQRARGEPVYNPVAVNPDGALRRIALARGWPVLEFSELLIPSRREPSLRRRTVYGLPLVLGAGSAVWAARRRAA